VNCTKKTIEITMKKGKTLTQEQLVKAFKAQPKYKVKKFEAVKAKKA